MKREELINGKVYVTDVKNPGYMVRASDDMRETFYVNMGSYIASI